MLVQQRLEQGRVCIFDPHLGTVLHHRLAHRANAVRKWSSFSRGRDLVPLDGDLHRPLRDIRKDLQRIEPLLGRPSCRC